MAKQTVVFGSAGFVWLFQDFKNARSGEMPQLLSDHPNDQHRIDAVEKHMRDNPSAFANYSPDELRAVIALTLRIEKDGLRQQVQLKLNSKGEKQSWTECW